MRCRRCAADVASPRIRRSHLEYRSRRRLRFAGLRLRVVRVSSARRRHRAPPPFRLIAAPPDRLDRAVSGRLACRNSARGATVDRPLFIAVGAAVHAVRDRGVHCPGSARGHRHPCSNDAAPRGGIARRTAQISRPVAQRRRARRAGRAAARRVGRAHHRQRPAGRSARQGNHRLHPARALQALLFYAWRPRAAPVRGRMLSTTLPAVIALASLRFLPTPIGGLRLLQTPASPSTLHAFFPHEKHRTVNCIACHHNFVDNTGAGSCFDCHRSARHDLPQASEATFHKFCRDCHRDLATEHSKHGPVRECSGCHVEQPAAGVLSNNTAICQTCANAKPDQRSWVYMAADAWGF